MQRHGAGAKDVHSAVNGRALVEPDDGTRSPGIVRVNHGLSKIAKVNPENGFAAVVFDTVKHPRDVVIGINDVVVYGEIVTGPTGKRRNFPASP